MRQKDCTMISRWARPRAYRLCWAAVIGFLAAAAAQAEAQPSAAMMEPVQGLVIFMSTLRRGEQPTVFARRGLCIVESFAAFTLQ